MRRRSSALSVALLEEDAVVTGDLAEVVHPGGGDNDLDVLGRACPVVRLSRRRSAATRTECW